MNQDYEGERVGCDRRSKGEPLEPDPPAVALKLKICILDSSQDCKVFLKADVNY